LETEGDDVAHQSHVLANVFGQAIVRARHGDHGLAAVACIHGGFVFGGAHAFDARFDFAHAGEVFVELGFVAAAHAPAQARRFIADPIKNTLGAAIPAIIEEAVE